MRMLLLISTEPHSNEGAAGYDANRGGSETLAHGERGKWKCQRYASRSLSSLTFLWARPLLVARGRGAAPRVADLVERLDIESYSDFSAK